MNRSLNVDILTSTAPAQMSFGRQLNAYLTEIKFETLMSLRTPAFAIPFLLLPPLIYLMFGVIMVIPTEGDARPELANYLFSGFSVMASMMAGIFGGCVGVSAERENGLLKLKRALPTPAGAGLIAKMTMSMIVSSLAIGLIVMVALLADTTTLTAAQIVAIWSTLTICTIPLFAIGYCIGAFASASASPAWGNLAFLPMMWLSGLFIPLPGFLEPWTIIWPAFHANQIAIGLAGITEFSFFPPLMSAGILLGVTLLFGGIATHKLTRKG